MKTKEEYLKSLSFYALLNLLEDAIRHNHYCPIECHCFDKWEHKFDVAEVKKEIIDLVNRSIST